MKKKSRHIGFSSRRVGGSLARIIRGLWMVFVSLCPITKKLKLNGEKLNQIKKRKLHLCGGQLKGAT